MQQIFLATLLMFVLMLGFLFPSLLSATELEPAEILKRAEASYAIVSDYSCLFHRRELVGNRYYEDKNVEVKFKKPHSYYMRWTEGEDKGQEAIYSEGRYDNELQAHSGGFLSFVSVSLDPNGAIAQRKGNHPIYQLDIGYLLKLLRDNYELYVRLQLGTILVEENLLNGTDYLRIRAEFPEGKGFYAKKIYVHFDALTSLPVRIEAYDWQGKLRERFSFTNLQLNRGFTEKDFSIENQEYDF